METNAAFSTCRRYRYVLWRVWDDVNPKVMFIGLNPSTANETADDATIRRVVQIAKNLGFGGVYMLNCFPFISTNPDDLKDFGNTALNDHYLYATARKCQEIIFAWGNFKIVKETGRDVELAGMFPGAKALHINKNGSPKHPLYCKADIQPVEYSKK